MGFLKPHCTLAPKTWVLRIPSEQTANLAEPMAHQSNPNASIFYQTRISAILFPFDSVRVGNGRYHRTHIARLAQSTRVFTRTLT